MPKLLSTTCGAIGSGKPAACTSKSTPPCFAAILATSPSGPRSVALRIAPLASSTMSACRFFGSVAGPGTSRLFTTISSMLKLSPRTVANSASPIASCGRLRPSSSMRLNSFLSPKIAPGEPNAVTCLIFASPMVTSWKRTCGPVSSHRLAEPILTGRPSASVATRS